MDGFKLLIVLEIAFNIFAFLIVAGCLFVFLKNPIIHINLVRLIKCIFAYYSISQFLRLIVSIQELAADKQFKFLSGSTTFLFLPPSSTGTFRILGIIRLFTLISMYIATWSAVIERTYATIKLKNYETTVSNKFFACCVFYHLLFGLLFTYLIHHEFLNLPMIGGSIFITNAAFCGHLYYLKWYNEKCYKTSLTNPSRYSLSERFQLQENIKTVGTVGRIGISLFILNLIGVGTITAANWYSSAASQQLGYILLQIGSSFYGLCGTLTGVTVNKQWCNNLKQLLNFVLKRRHVEDIDAQRINLSNRVLTYNGQKMIFSLDEEREVYFKQLQNGWN